MISHSVSKKHLEKGKSTSSWSSFDLSCCRDAEYLVHFHIVVSQRAKIIPTVLALRTTTYLGRERDYMPWQSALNNLNFFYLMFDRSEVYGPMQVCLLHCNSTTHISSCSHPHLHHHPLNSASVVFRSI